MADNKVGGGTIFIIAALAAVGIAIGRGGSEVTESGYDSIQASDTFQNYIQQNGLNPNGNKLGLYVELFCSDTSKRKPAFPVENLVDPARTTLTAIGEGDTLPKAQQLVPADQFDPQQTYVKIIPAAGNRRSQDRVQVYLPKEDFHFRQTGFHADLQQIVKEPCFEEK